MKQDREPKEVKAKLDNEEIKAQDNRYKAQPVDGYKPLFKRLHQRFPTKNYQVED
jgi:hypothetical protein